MRGLVRPGVWIACVLLPQLAAAALSFDVTYIDDTNATFASRGWLDSSSLFQQNISAALALWGSKFDSDATIVVDIDPVSYSARAGGTNTLGRYLYTNADGKDVWEFGPLTRMLTGNNPGYDEYGFDILLGFDANFVENFYWFDPQPTLRTDPVPSDKGDFMSVVLHELGHGFGMTGYRDASTGLIEGPMATQFDDLSYYGGDGQPFDGGGEPNPMFFRGNVGAMFYGSDLPLTHKPVGHPNHPQNFFHLSACDSPGDGLDGTLMNGCVLPNGERLNITPFDLAVFADLGYPVINPAGDFNYDGTVDAADYVVWRRTLGDAETYGVWRTNFGETFGGGGAGAGFGSGSNVPEPGTGIGLCFAVLVCYWRMPSRRSRTPIRSASEGSLADASGWCSGSGLR